MKFSVEKEALISPLALVASVVERRQTLPVLANILCVVEDGQLRLTGTDQEVELSVSISELTDAVSGEVTVPAQKFFDICRSLPGQALVEVSLEGNRASLHSGRFKSHLATLPAIEFPKVELDSAAMQLEVPVTALRELLESTGFAMALQDVRYFFNGMLLEFGDGVLRTVATNGQRLAIAERDLEQQELDVKQFIIPRKGVLELSKLLKDIKDESVSLLMSPNHLSVVGSTANFTTKLIDGSYPDYTGAIPTNSDKILLLDRLELKDALSRIAILSNEMYRNVKLCLSNGELQLKANNPMQEEAEEVMSIGYEGDDLEIGFNVSYLIDVLQKMDGTKVKLELSDQNSPVLMTNPEDAQSRFVVSPMML
ncbi:MAG: DNA polymerase III subunit beta [Pseudomonadales bacterium]|nr:DNA polymerase III subunit beta [Pseudomonadales bacterium]MDG1442585.1 DNA polymerase III subunit beta [Pseudomonadales bacterium]